MKTTPPSQITHTYNYALLDHFLTTGVAPCDLTDHIDEALWAIVCQLAGNDAEKKGMTRAYSDLKELREILVHLDKNK